MINESGKLHMVPALLNELYVIRFAICAHSASEHDVHYAWDVISASATELLDGRRNSSKEADSRFSFESVSESDDEVFDTDFDDQFIFDHQRCNVRRAHMQRSFFFKMVSDPKSYNPRVLRSLRSHSLGSPAGTPGSSSSHRVLENGCLHNGTPP